MTAIHKDRVMEVSNTTGTGSFLLGGPQSGYYTFFESFGAGVTLGYAAANPITGENEVGYGQVINNGDGTYSLSRDTIERSSNANAKVDFAAGRKIIANVLLASEADLLTSIANAIQKDGSVAFTGNQSLGGHDLTNVGKINKVTITTPATGATVTLAEGSSLITSGGNAVTLTSTGTTNATIPSGTHTLVATDTTDTLTNKTLTSPILNTPTLNSSGGALTLPAGPDTLVGRATTDTLTNKTLTSPILTTPTLGVASATTINKVTITPPATGSTLTVADGKTLAANNSITLSGTDGKTLTLSNSVTLAGTDGSTLNVGAGGTLAALAFKSSVDLSGSDATGTIAAARMPALTGDVTTSAGAVATTIGSNVLTYAKFQQVAASSLVGNPTGSLANAQGVTLGTSLQFSGTTLNTIQGLRTSDSPTFAAVSAGSLAIAASTQIWADVSRATGNLEFKMFNSNTAGYEVLNFGEVYGTNQASMYAFNTTYTSSGRYQANSLTFEKLGASGQVNFITPSTLTIFKSDSTGLVTLNSSGQLGVGIGTSFSPLAKIEGRATSGAQLAASYDASNSLTVTVSSAGLATFTGAGTSKGLVFTDGIQAGTGAGRAKVCGTLKTISTTSANSGSAETDLHSFTLLGNTLAADGDSIRSTMTWKTFGNSNLKTIKVKFGATTVVDSSTGTANLVWLTVIVTITRKSATTQVASFIFMPSIGTGWSSPYGGEVDCSETLSGSVILKATGQGTSTNDVTQIQTIVEYLPANP